MRQLLTFLALCLAPFAALAQCDGDHHVAVYNYTFHPAEITIDAGESVSFRNYGGWHSINGETSYTGESLNNPVPFSLDANYGWWLWGNCMGTVTFDVPGVYTYECGVGDNAEDEGMIGTIIVEGDMPTTTVVDVIVNSDVHNILEAAVIGADLAGALSGDGPFTVFAPTDDAFIALAGALGAEPEDLLDLDGLSDILLYHVVGAQVLSTDLADGATATTLNGADVTVTINDDGIFINDAQVIVADITTDNGVVHVIDAVLLPPTEPEPFTVVDVIVNSDVHNLLEAAVGAAGLVDALNGEGPFTVFAPTDDAFIALAGALGAAPEDLLDLDGLSDILLYHVVGAQVLSTDLADGATATTLNGADVTVTINDDGIFINDAQVIVADITTDNGVVHVIDAVLLPPTEPEPFTVVDVIVNSDVHNLLEAAVGAAGLVDALNGEGPFTVFAPTDDAFIALAGALGAAPEDLLDLDGLSDILLYHVVGAQVLSTDLADGATATTLNGADVTVTINDDGIFINDAQVIVADITTDNGVVHVIDAVLLPPTEPEPFTVVDVIVNSDVHNILEAAVIEADLAGALSGDGPFTVFAPTDDAFAALAFALDATAEDLLALPELADILLYHVVGAQVLSTDLADGATATTLNGEDITVTINDDGIFINDAQVIVADITTDNGVVHVIDAVLLPPTEPEPFTVVDVIVNSDVHNLLEAAVGAAGLVDALNGEGPFTVFAPTDDAFIALAGALGVSAEDLLALPELSDILLYHVIGAQVLSTDLVDGATATTLLGEDVTVTINDDGIFINDAQVIVADIETDNGVVHVIDAVLLVPEPYTVVDVIVNSDVHTLLEAAVGAAGLVDALNGEGPFTVFAPTDDAFIALAGALGVSAEDLLALPELADILLYHVVGAQVLSTDLSDGATATTLNGADVTVEIDCAGDIFINDAQVTVADIVTDNGVVHVIDAVLLPPTPENDCADGDCCGEGTIWDAELGQCVVEDVGCEGDMDGDLIVSVGDILTLLIFFGDPCE